ncbi:MAG: pyruvate dehydrogenase (acetyl-transferring) E1 component subunit alpha [Flavobacteriaceae bacterium]|nr:pyruvate dehydrogenase (acetyl-transferring) E1 component subunit alpha [Flavobacteriaceae bacterium]
MKFGKKEYINWYKIMLLQRRFEEKVAQLYGQQKIKGFCHLYIGQEAITSGMVSAIKKGDKVITAYRDHGHALSMGVSANAVMAELFGKASGCTGGKGGSMHMFSKAHNFVGGHGIVGAQIPLGAGLAFAEKYNDTSNVSLTFFGDGAARQGALHEAFNMAMLWKLPVVFICENNEYAMGTSVARTSNLLEIYKIGLAYDMPSFQVDGMRCEAVHEAIYNACEHAREGKGPVFLEIKTYRYRGHSMSDPASYRTRNEVADYKEKDPLETTKASILEKKYATELELDLIEEGIINEVDASVVFAENADYPEARDLFKDVYVENDYPYITD